MKGELGNTLAQVATICGPDDVGKVYPFVIKDKSKGSLRNLGQ